MEPLIRILIRNGVSYAEFHEVMKSAFVEVAERDFNLPNRTPSQSRIAILTGLSRKEVAKQKSLIESGESLAASSNLNRVTRVLLGWHSDPDYTGPYGMPMELPFESVTGSTFTTLVRRYSGDMPPRAMLDELLRVGAVEQLSSGALRVLTRAYIPERLHPDALERFGDVVRNFVNTLEYNMETMYGPKRFERRVVADNGIPEDKLLEFDALLKSKAQQLLVEFDNWFSAQESEESNQEVRRVTTGVGIYHFMEQDD